jgi:hypothetical protein
MPSMAHGSQNKLFTRWATLRLIAVVRISL